VTDFIVNNLALVALFVASGAMLLYPELARLGFAGGSQQLGTLEATRLMNQSNSLVLDVREAKEFAEGRLPRSRHIPLAELGGRIGEISKYKERPVLLTCRSGARSAGAARTLKKAGFAQIFQLKGGISAWREAGLPIEK
jgi:rhodanese-related sulfurtransferase